MKIEVSGRPSRMFRGEVEYAAVFFAQYLMPEKVWKGLNIKVELAKPDKEYLGHCLSEDDGKRKRNFTISIKRDMARHLMLKTIAHEMVHVKQYAMGEFEHFFNIATFKGSVYSIKNSSLEDYLNWPWEIEAFGRDQGLYLIYQLMLRQEKIKFKNGKLFMGGKLMTKKRLLSLAKDAKIKF